MAELGFQYQLAVDDFRRARRRASMEQIMTSLRGKSSGLLSYEDVRQKLRVTGSVRRGLQEIPLDAIIGSVGRYTDFTRTFLPIHDGDESRWARIDAIARGGLGGFPPIDVYQINDAYFVLDGNHRVSVAHEMGADSIEAYVTEIRTKVPLSKDTQPDELILKAGYVDFLEQTQIDQHLPDVDLSVTAPGKYNVLKEHLDAHHYCLQEKERGDVPYEEAVMSWYEHVYRPIEHIIRQRGMLRDFPGRTPTDLFLWIMEHRAELRKHLGWTVSPEAVATDLISHSSSRLRHVAERFGTRLHKILTPLELEPGPAPGQWRKEEVISRREDRLFSSILVPVNGREGGWYALDQGIEIARHEEGQLYGLYVVPAEGEQRSSRAKNIKVEFLRRCEEAGILGEFAIVSGKVARRITGRARWADLVVINVDYLPRGDFQPLTRFRSPIRALIQQCPRPILAVSRMSTNITAALLAYNGSPKANEALFVSAYLAGRLNVQLFVITVAGAKHTGPDLLTYAKDYLKKHEVDATFINETGSVHSAIIKTALKHHCDLVIMGGYGRDPVLEILFGSTTDHILRTKKFPVLICR